MRLNKFLLPIFLLLTISPLCAQEQKQEELSALLGGMVQSDKWIIRKDKAEEEFIGNVKYENENYKITANRALSQRRLNAYTISGNVSAQRKQDGQTASVKADKIFYNQKKDTGYIKGSRKKQLMLSLSDINNQFKLYADTLNFTAKFSVFEAEGDCELNDLDNTLYADKMTYDVETGIFTAEESRPVLFGYNADGDYALQADKITADNKNGLYKASGRVMGWLVPAEDITKYTQGQDNGAKIF